MTALKHPLALHIDDERAIGNSIIVTLKPGYRFVNCGDAETVCGFDSVQQFHAAMRSVEEHDLQSWLNGTQNQYFQEGKKTS